MEILTECLGMALRLVTTQVCSAAEAKPEDEAGGGGVLPEGEQEGGAQCGGCHGGGGGRGEAGGERCVPRFPTEHKHPVGHRGDTVLTRQKRNSH